MNLATYIEAMRSQLIAAADAGGPEGRAAIERLVPGLEAAVRVVLLEALSAAADEITREMAPGSVEIRLRGSDPEFVVGLPAFEPADETTSSATVGGPAVIQPGDDEGGTSRLNLRLPEGLKARIEEAARREGLSLNAWLVRSAAAAVEGPSRPTPPQSSATSRRGSTDVHRMGPVMTPTCVQRHVSGATMHTFETNQPIALSIEISHGAVHIIASDRTDTVVAVNPSDPERSDDVQAAAKTVVDLTNGALSIRQPKPGGIAAPVIGWKSRGAIDVTVELPARSSLRADTGLADFRCDGRLDDVDVKTGAGAVRLDHTAALRVRTSAGNVTVEEASGNAEIVASGEITVGAVAGGADIKNLNGRTWIGRVDGDVKVKSANGDVTIDDAGGDVTAKTANGNIRLGQVARGTVSIETASGALAIGVKEGTAAWIDATTKFGRLHNHLTPAETPAPAAETVQVRARTSFGDITITRS